MEEIYDFSEGHGLFTELTTDSRYQTGNVTLTQPDYTTPGGLNSHMEQPDFVPFIDFSTAYNQSSQIESFFPFDAESGRQVFANDGHSDIISNNYPEYWGGLTSVHQQQIPTEFPDTYDPENKFSQLSGMDQSMGLLPSTSYIQLENQMVRPEYPNSWWLTDVTQPPPVHSAQSTMANEFDKPQVHPGSLYCETPLGDRKTLFLIAQSSLNGYCALSSNPSSVESSPTESIFDQAIGSRRSSYESVCQASNYTSLLKIDPPVFTNFSLNTPKTSHTMPGSPMQSPRSNGFPIDTANSGPHAPISTSRNTAANKKRSTSLKCTEEGCTSTFSGKRRFSTLNLKRHLSSVHKKGKIYSCRSCSKRFNRSDNRLAHERKLHTNVKKHHT